MTAVAQELTCPHERREIPDRDHNKRSFLAFSLFFTPMERWRTSNSH